MQKNISRTTISQQEITLEHVFKTLHGQLYFYALKFIGDREVAKDVVQDAFLGILKQNENVLIENQKSFLYQSVRNNCLNYLKHLKIEKNFQEKELQRSLREIGFYNTHQTLVEKEEHHQILKTIEDLPENYRIPFEMSRFENLKTKIIAEQLGIPVRTVETRIYRAIKILREKLKEQLIILFCISFSKN